MAAAVEAAAAAEAELEAEEAEGTPCGFAAGGAAHGRTIFVTMCAEARFFAGNVFSSFTHHVCYLRVLRGVPAACVGSDVYGREADPRTEWV